MKKVNLLIIGLFMLFSLPMVLGAQNAILNVSGNHTDNPYILYFDLTTTQVTVNPGIGVNVTYLTQVNVTSNGTATYNLSAFSFYPPENHTSVVPTSFKLNNVTGGSTLALNATAFVVANGTTDFYNYVIFTGVGDYLNHSSNATLFNITWILSEPIASTKIATVRSGRTYTETWNITSAASNRTIENASLLVTPSYWYTRIGVPTTITFNGTAMNSSSNFTNIDVWTNLDLGIGGNLVNYGSGFGTLSVVYNGPIVASSSGSSPSAVVPTAEITPTNFALWALIIFGVMFVVVMMVSLIYLFRKRK